MPALSLQGNELSLRASKTTRADAVRLVLANYHGNPCLDDVTDIVADLRDSKDVPACSSLIDEIAAFVRLASITNPRLRVAVVASSIEVFAGTKTYAAFGSSHFPIKVFGSMESARDWLAKTPLRSKHASMLEY